MVSEDGRVSGEINTDSAETHSVRLLEGIDYLLRSLQLSLNDVDAFAVISGPGSFTGVRIGLTTIKGLAETTGKPIISLTAFEAWVEKFPLENGILVPLINAHRGEVYSMVLERTDKQLCTLSDGMVENLAQLLGRLNHEAILFIGDGSMKYHDLISEQHKPLWKVASSDTFLGRPMADLAHRKALQGDFTSSLDLKAYYLRKSDAELYWKDK